MPLAAPDLGSPSGMPSASAEKPAEILAPAQHRFHFTASAELLGLVERLRGFLRHKHPEGRLEDIFIEACGALMEKIEKDRRPTPAARRQAPPATKRSRRIPASVKREVWQRDDGRCAFVSADHRRCESREALEYDHVIPWACGGRSDQAQNIRLLCRSHNQALARIRFGRPSKGADRATPPSEAPSKEPKE